MVVTLNIKIQIKYGLNFRVVMFRVTVIPLKSLKAKLPVGRLGNNFIDVFIKVKFFTLL